MDMDLDQELNGHQQDAEGPEIAAQQAAAEAAAVADQAVQQAAQAQAFLQALAGQLNNAALPPRPQPQQVKLPDFWENEPLLWFERAEAQFRRCSVVESRQQADIVLKSVRDILQDRTAPDTTLYHRLRERLLRRFQPSKWQLAYQVIHHPGIGDLRPSQLLDAMLSLLPPGEQPGNLFQALFLERLPAEMRNQLAADTFESVREMAVKADSIWDARAERFHAGVSTSPGRNRKNRKKSPGRRKLASTITPLVRALSSASRRVPGRETGRPPAATSGTSAVRRPAHLPARSAVWTAVPG